MDLSYLPGLQLRIYEVKLGFWSLWALYLKSSEDGDGMFLQTASIYLRVYTAQNNSIVILAVKGTYGVGVITTPAL
jgi:hypothetical protein